MRAIRYGVALALAISIVACNGDVHPIATFDGFCKAVLTPPRRNAFVTESRYFAPNPIRASFVRWYDSVVVQVASDQSFGGVPPTDSVLRELRRLRLIGVWNDQTHLHVADFAWGAASDAVAPSFDSIVAQYRRFLLLDPKPPMDSVQECTFAAINALFSSLTVHGSQRVVPIQTAYYLRDQEWYNQPDTDFKGNPK